MESARRDINYKILRYVHSGERVLSIGCGSGKLEEEMQKRGVTVYGVDIDPDAVRAARGRLTGVSELDIELCDRLPFPGERFDVVICIDVLEHLRDPARILRMACNRLIPGGRVIVSLPNVANWSVRLSLLGGRFDYTEHGILDRTHLRFYTLKTIGELTASCGLVITRVDYTTNLLNALYGRLNPRASRTQEARHAGLPARRPSWRGRLRRALERTDELLGAAAKGFFAFQFIIVARPRRKL